MRPLPELPATIQTACDINWPELRSRAMALRTRKSKGSADWNDRACSFAKKVQDSTYTSNVLKKLPVTRQTTVLDIGCGPGTLALPLAEKAGRITALDFSEKMLSLLNDSAAAKGLNNIKTAHLSWEDDWHQAGIEPHDITLASRSTSVTDLPAALQKLNQFAKQAVFLTDRISPTPFDPEAFAAVGIEFNPGPDYIYTLNILHSMGIAADVTVIEFDQIRNYTNLEEALHNLLWMFDELNEAQTSRLREYLSSISYEETDGSITITRATPPRWALISWKKQ